MAKKDVEKLTATEKFADKTNTWIGDHSRLLLSIGIFVIALLLVLVIVVAINSKSSEKRYDSLSALESSYTNREEIGDEEFINEANALISDAGIKSYPGAKAALLLADVYYGNEDYQSALDLYNQIASAQSKTYLYQVAMINVAACNEMLGDSAVALDIYNSLWENFGKDGLYGSRALFNSARLYEAQGNVELAKATYEQLAGEYSGSQSEYASLATTRLSQLN